MTEEQSSVPPSVKLKRRVLHVTLAALFAMGGWGLCTWSWQHYRKVYNPPKTPVPVMELIPVIPQGQQASVAQAITLASSLALGLNPDQQARVREIWKVPPKSLQELIGKTRQVDKVLTPAQLARFKPMRRMVQNQIVDALFEAGRNRFSPQDFNRMKDTIKQRVEQRMTAP